MRTYKDVITIQSFITVPPSPAKQPHKCFSVLCSVWLDNSVESMLAGGDTATVGGKVHLRPNSFISPDCEILYKGNTWNVVGEPLPTGKGDEVIIKILRRLQG